VIYLHSLPQQRDITPAMSPQYVFGGPAVFPNATLHYIPAHTLVWTKVVLKEPATITQVTFNYYWRSNSSGVLTAGVYVNGILKYTSNQTLVADQESSAIIGGAPYLFLNTTFPAGTTLEIAFVSTIPVWVLGYPSNFNQSWVRSHFLANASTSTWVPVSSVTFTSSVYMNTLQVTLSTPEIISEWVFVVGGLYIPKATTGGLHTTWSRESY